MRSLTVKGPEGNYVTVTVPEEVKRFDSLKVGDRVDITWTEALLISVE
jgi:hypothetical protein